MIVELALRIDQTSITVKAIKQQRYRNKVYERIDKIEKWVQRGRVLVFILAFANLAFFYSYLWFGWDTSSQGFLMRAPKIIAYCFLGIFFIMGAVTFFLHTRMRA